MLALPRTRRVTRTALFPIATINGNGATVKVTNNFKEYVDDDYCVAGVGGLFSTIGFISSSYVKSSVTNNGDANVANLNFSNCNVSLTFINSSGEEQSPFGSQSYWGKGKTEEVRSALAVLLVPRLISDSPIR